MIVRFTALHAVLSSAIATTTALADNGSGDNTEYRNEQHEKLMTGVTESQQKHNHKSNNLDHSHYHESLRGSLDETINLEFPLPEMKDELQRTTLLTNPKGNQEIVDTIGESSVENTYFDQSRELGILGSSEISSPTQSPTVDDCGGYRPQVKPTTDFAALVYTCLYHSHDCPYPDTELNCWDTSRVTDMSKAFYNTFFFNDRIEDWDTSSVTKMRNMFEGARSFNQPLNSWNTSKVTDMNKMFCDAESFNQPLSNFQTHQVEDMNRMFQQARSFNQPIDSWEPHKVKGLFSMFEGAESFNQCISTWADKTMKYYHDIGAGTMLRDSGCPYTSIQDKNIGPWCQGASQECFVSSSSGTMGISMTNNDWWLSALGTPIVGWFLL